MLRLVSYGNISPFGRKEDQRLRMKVICPQPKQSSLIIHHPRLFCFFILFNGLVVKAGSTYAGGPGLILGADEKQSGSWHLLPDRIDFSNGSIYRGSLYNCTLQASKRSLKVSKCKGLLDVLGKLY